MGLTRRFLTDSFFYFLSSATSSLCGVILLPFYTRVFSVADYGVLSLLFIVNSMLLLFISLQLDQAVARYFVDTQSQSEKKSIATVGLVYYIVAFGFTALIMVCFSGVISGFIFSTVDKADIIKILAVSLFLNALNNYNSNMLKWSFKSRLVAIFSLAGFVLIAIFNFICVGYFDLGISGVFVGQATAFLILTIMMFFCTWQYYDLMLLSKKTFGYMLKFGIPLVPMAVSLSCMQYADRMIISKMLGLSAVGIYSLGIRIGSIIQLAISGFQMAWGPLIFQNYKDIKTKQFIAGVFDWVILGTSVIMYVFSVFAPEILRVFTTPKFYSAYTIVPYIVFSTLMFFVAGYFSVGIYIAAKNWLRVYINFIALLLNILLNILLVYYVGIEGAAIALVLSSLIMASFSIIISNRYYYLGLQYKKNVTMIILTFICVFAMRFIFGLHIDFFSFIVKCIVFIGMGGVFCLFKLVDLRKLPMEQKNI